MRRLTVALLPALFVLPGCSEKKSDVEVFNLDNAKIENIDLKSDDEGTIRVSFYNEKYKQDVVDEGIVTRETEILINGALGRLKDLRVGERVHGQVRTQRQGKKKQRVAVRIVVDRPTPVGG